MRPTPRSASRTWIRCSTCSASPAMRSRPRTPGPDPAALTCGPRDPWLGRRRFVAGDEPQQRLLRVPGQDAQDRAPGDPGDLLDLVDADPRRGGLADDLVPPGLRLGPTAQLVLRIRHGRRRHAANANAYPRRITANRAGHGGTLAPRRAGRPDPGQLAAPGTTRLAGRLRRLLRGTVRRGPGHGRGRFGSVRALRPAGGPSVA